MWRHCVSDALVCWSGLFLLSPRACSQHGSSSNIDRFACLCLYEWQGVSIMLLSLCMEAGWMFSSRWDHGSVGSTLIWHVVKKRGKKNFHWRSTLCAHAVTHVMCLSGTSTCPNFVFRSFPSSINECRIWNQHVLFYYWYKFNIFSGRHPIRPTEHYQEIKKSKHAKGFDVFIV